MLDILLEKNHYLHYLLLCFIIKIKLINFKRLKIKLKYMIDRLKIWMLNLKLIIKIRKYTYLYLIRLKILLRKFKNYG